MIGCVLGIALILAGFGIALELGGSGFAFVVFVLIFWGAALLVDTNEYRELKAAIRRGYDFARSGDEKPKRG